jgi:hypothetical protein
MKKFVQDLFTDGAGKYSSKRAMGISAGLAGLAMAILAGLKFYDIEPTIIQTVLTFSGALLGISVFSKEA